jgi:hypothetical protein
MGGRRQWPHGNQEGLVMNIGERIVSEIIKQGMVRVAHPDPDEPHVFVWSENSYDQLSALVDHLTRKEPNMKSWLIETRYFGIFAGWRMVEDWPTTPNGWWNDAFCVMLRLSHARAYLRLGKCAKGAA